MAKASPRTLRGNQSCQVWTYDTESGKQRLLFETDKILLEAPNWTLDGEALILNGAGTLWRLVLANPVLEPIKISNVPPLNNDHVLDPDGTHVFLSAYDDFQLYRAPLAGGIAQKVTQAESAPGLLHFLHGVSPTGKLLAFVGITLDETVTTFKLAAAEIFTVKSDGTDYRQLTKANSPADGPEFSPDGARLYFNTEQFSGHAQIARMHCDGSNVERLSHSLTVDWFPHISPDGTQIVYLAYPAGTKGHPADLDVELMLVKDDDWTSATSAVKLFGGQGTINVNSWSPDSICFAYVAYPLKP